MVRSVAYNTSMRVDAVIIVPAPSGSIEETAICLHRTGTLGFSPLSFGGTFIGFQVGVFWRSCMTEPEPIDVHPLVIGLKALKRFPSAKSFYDPMHCRVQLLLVGGDG